MPSSRVDDVGPSWHNRACGHWPLRTRGCAVGCKCGDTLGMLSPKALLLLIRNGGEWPTGSITTPLPKLLKPWVFIQRSAKWRLHPQNVKRQRWLSLFWYIMHFATVVCVETCLLCLINLCMWACKHYVLTYTHTWSTAHMRARTHTRAHTGQSYLL